MERCYSSILARLETHRALLDRVVAILVETQEVTGPELRRLLDQDVGDGGA